MTAFSYGLALPWLNPEDLNEAGKYGEATCVDLLKRGLPCLNPQDLNEANFLPQSLEFGGKSLPRLNPDDLSKACLFSASQHRLPRHISLCLV